jgi:hypothetical protein
MQVFAHGGITLEDMKSTSELNRDSTLFAFDPFCANANIACPSGWIRIRRPWLSNPGLLP